MTSTTATAGERRAEALRQARESIRHNPDPYWRRAHRDWKVWVGLFFMMAAITIYVMSKICRSSPADNRRHCPTCREGSETNEWNPFFIPCD